MNVVMNLQVPFIAGNIACILPGQAKDLSALLYLCESRIVDGIDSFVTATFQLRNVLSLHFVCLSYALSAQNVYIGSRQTVGNFNVLHVTFSATVKYT